MGFNDQWVDIIYRHISNNWYSIVLNGTRNGFFKSNRGLRQGDPLSPALFVICAELLSRLLNNLSLDDNYSGYYRPRKGPSITHIAFADDVIFFTSCKPSDIRKVMRILIVYENVSSQQVNKSKIYVAVATKTMHLLAAMKPPKGTFEQLEGALNSFLWNDNGTKRKYHWSKWESMCLLNEEGGVGFRCLRDVSEAFIAKQWWNLRTKESMWKKYMMAKYCSRVNSIIKKSVGLQSQTWRALGKVKHQVEDNIVWQIGQGRESFWYHNWTGVGALYKLLPEDYSPNNIRLNEAYEEGTWQWDRAGYRVPETIRWEVQHITIHFTENKEDKAIWTPNLEGKFTMSSTWNLLRKKANGDWHDRRTWHKSCSLKVNFHMWRIIKNRLATDNNIGRKSIRIVKWIPPPPSFIKLNSDGSCRDEICGGGGVIRNNKGKLIQAYSMNLGKGTSNWAEAKALQHGIEWCINECWRKIIVESDSLLVVQEIQGKVADKLAQVGHSHNDIVTYKEFQELPTSVRGILNIDRMGLPNIRTRPISNSNYYFDPP
ncbi:uncharacterized protein LOC132630398 [Lycium barbarum]|uniref:uncharacterized protein LOC132630398 n=1 Tax=Lycium barbarum TaxID=112863 RepID=UPI00293F1D32|nr:uncharacterized protein LOC132630398 [Lycium barbarum]